MARSGSAFNSMSKRAQVRRPEVTPKRSSSSSRSGVRPLRNSWRALNSPILRTLWPATTVTSALSPRMPTWSLQGSANNNTILLRRGPRPRRKLMEVQRRARSAKCCLTGSIQLLTEVTPWMTLNMRTTTRRRPPASNTLLLTNLMPVWEAKYKRGSDIVNKMKILHAQRNNLREPLTRLAWARGSQCKISRLLIHSLPTRRISTVTACIHRVWRLSRRKI